MNVSERVCSSRVYISIYSHVHIYIYIYIYIKRCNRAATGLQQTWSITVPEKVCRTKTGTRVIHTYILHIWVIHTYILHICIYLNIYKYIYIYRYTHTHTHTSALVMYMYMYRLGDWESARTKTENSCCAGYICKHIHI